MKHPGSDCAALCDELALRFCPRCGERALQPKDSRAVHCERCEFLYYHNNAAAAGTVVHCGDEVLFIERGENPAKGLLDVPGGFVDYGETLEQAAIRETHEEVGLLLERVAYVASFPNVYRYRDVVYQTCDVYFEAHLHTKPRLQAGDDAAACHWRRPADVAPEDMAFDSVRRLLRLLIGQ